MCMCNVSHSTFTRFTRFSSYGQKSSRHLLPSLNRTSTGMCQIKGERGEIFGHPPLRASPPFPHGPPTPPGPPSFSYALEPLAPSNPPHSTMLAEALNPPDLPDPVFANSFPFSPDERRSRPGFSSYVHLVYPPDQLPISLATRWIPPFACSTPRHADSLRSALAFRRLSPYVNGALRMRARASVLR
jgi:hypothetical protein